MEELYGTRYQRGSFSLVDVGSAFHCLHSFFLNNDNMVFFSRNIPVIPTFTYDGIPPELVTQFKYLGFTLTRDGSMHTAAEKMADNFRSTIASQSL